MLGGRKLGGILCEARWQGAALGWIAVGVGLNVRNPVPGELRETAVSLVELGPDITSWRPCCHSVAAAIREAGSAAQSGFRQRSWSVLPRGTGSTGGRFESRWPGIVAGLDEDGALLVHTPQGLDDVPPQRLGGVGGRFSHR